MRPFFQMLGAAGLSATVSACSPGASPPALPSPFAAFASSVGEAQVDESTMETLVLRYPSSDASGQWATWSAVLEREGYTWDGNPGDAMGMTFDTFTAPDGHTRKLIVTARGGATFVQMSLEN
ncbi:MAG: hypothetical protein ACJAZO_002040 [Myxococcota bacterium]|jgi:hypothetical protein